MKEGGRYWKYFDVGKLLRSNLSQESFLESVTSWTRAGIVHVATSDKGLKLEGGSHYLHSSTTVYCRKFKVVCVFFLLFLIRISPGSWYRLSRCLGIWRWEQTETMLRTGESITMKRCSRTSRWPIQGIERGNRNTATQICGNWCLSILRRCCWL